MNPNKLWVKKNRHSIPWKEYFIAKRWYYVGAVFAIVVSISLVAQSVTGAGAASDGGQAPVETKLALPDAFGEPRSVRVAPSLGAVADQIPLVVPPGRRGIEPHLTLNYSSMAGLGTLGLGWFLETGYVEIWRGDGTPTVGNPDSFVYSLAGAGGQLVNTGDGIYRARLESIYREFRRNETNGGWEMYNGEGALHRFGGTPSSRIPGQQWMLDYVKDPHGNTITYTYERVGDVLYISEIQYTGYAPTGDPGANLVEFEYERRDDVRIDYGFSLPQEKSLRLKRISMFASGQLARRYELSYEDNPLNDMSMLKQIVLVGADDISRVVLRKLEYGSRSYGWNAKPTALFPLTDSNGLDTGNRIVDVNGDGFADLVGNDTTVRLGSGDNFDANNLSSKVWSDSLKAAYVSFVISTGDYKGADTGVRLLDVNSDGLPDLFIAQVGRRQIYLNTGNGWSYTDPVCSGELCTTGEQWSTGVFGLDSISSQAVYENTRNVVPPGIYDDTYAEWIYTGSWAADSSNVGAYEDTLHLSSAMGNSASITFLGTQFILTYTGDSNRGEVEIFVDDVHLHILNQYRDKQMSQESWISPVLADGVHTVRIVHKNGSIVDIDAIEFLNVDEIPPAAISDLTAVPGAEVGSVELAWTSPGDDGNSGIPTRYLVRYSPGKILTETDWDTATPTTNGIPFPGIAGISKSMIVNDLIPGGAYYFAIRAQDEAGNLGALSNSPIAAATLVPPAEGISGDGGDVTPPASIYDLAVVPSVVVGSVKLTWTAPGDDGNIGIAERYLVRYSTSEIYSEANWNIATPVENGVPSPDGVGTPENMTISGLTPGAIYYFAVRAQDEAGNLGALSNSPDTVAGSELLPIGGGSSGGDATSPASIYDLAAVSGMDVGSVELSWTAPGGDGNAGRANRYLVRYSANKIQTEVDWNTAIPVENGVPIPESAGTSERMTVSDLIPGAMYYFAVRAQDEADNLGALSKSPNAVAMGIFDDTDSKWQYSSGWVSEVADGAYGKSYQYTKDNGSYATLAFQGTEFKLYYTAGKDFGQLQVYVDDVLVDTLNEHDNQQVYQNTWTSLTMDDGMHIVRLVKKSGKYVNIDALEVLAASPRMASSNEKIVTASNRAQLSSVAVTIHFNNPEQASNNDNINNMPFALVSDHGDSMGVQLVDVNADGRVDIVWSYSLQNPPQDSFNCLADIRGVFLNTGRGWELDPTLTEALSDIDIDYFVVNTQLMGYDFLDVNGDGFADIVRTYEDKPREVLLGTGSGWEYDAGFSTSMVANNILSLSSDRKGQGLMPIDFNDDGLVDYLRANQVIIKAYANTGKGWVEAPEMSSVLGTLGIAFSTSDGMGTGVTIADINGDGLVDFARSKPGENETIYLSSGLRSGLLIRATSALGEVTELTWASSTQFDNTREDGVQGLPGAMTVVTSLTRKDGRENAHKTTYTYGGGWFTNRQFRGFRWTQQLLPSGLRMETTCHQEEGIAGQPDVERGYDIQGNVRIQNSTFYEIKDAAPGVKQITSVRSENVWSDPGGTRRSATEYTHDKYLNITSVLRDLDLDISGDESTTTFAWIINTAAGFWNLPGHVETYGPDGSLLAENILLYDGLPEGQVQHGLPSRVLDLVEPGRYVVKSMEYDSYGNVVRVYDRENNLSHFRYDDATATFLVEAIDHENRVTQSTYDPRFGAIIWDKDAAGNITTKEYDAFGRNIRIVLPGDEDSPYGTQTIAYSELGDANTQFYTVKKTETAGEASTLDTTYYFNGMGLVNRAEREGSGSRKVIVTTRYDDADNPVETSRPFFEGDEPSLTIYERDELHRPLRIIEPDGSQITTSYAGKRIDVIDQRGEKTSFYRDAEGNTTAIHQWVNGVEQVTSYQYDVLGQLVGITDALGEQTKITYDMLGRRTRLDDPNTGTYLYRYDDEDRLVEQTGPDGLTTRFEYNHAGDLLRKLFPDGSGQEFMYDSAGRLVQVTDAAGLLELVYDGRGNVVERKRTVLEKTYITGYVYDSLGRIRQITYPDGFAIQYEYDPGGNLARITDGNGRPVAGNMSYAASGQLLEIQFGNGVTSDFTYNELMRMSSISTVTINGEALQDLEYGYDAGSNILSITDNANSASQSFEYDAIGRLAKAIGAYGEETYKYDAIGNLLRKGETVFTFDPQHSQRVICGSDLSLDNGNANGIENNPHANPCEITSEKIITQASGKKTIRLGRPNNNLNLARSFQVNYDAYGNAIEKGGTQYEYDFENHLIRVRDAQGKLLVENTYDASGQRVMQETQQGTTVYVDGIYEEGKTYTSRHVQAGPLLIATISLPRAVTETFGGISPNLYNVLAGMVGFVLVLVGMPAQYTDRRKWWAGLSALKEAFQAHPRRLLVLLFILAAIVSSAAAPEFGAQTSQAQHATEKRYYYHSNHLGSINIVTDEKGKVVERREYKPYGEPFDWTGPNSGPREFLQTFDGQYYDDATGLYYFGARHYDPQLGRFLAADTQVPDPTNPKDLHRYAFAGGNPIRYVDPTGHDVWDWVVGIIVVIGLVVLGILTFGAIYYFGIAFFSVAGGILFTIGMAAIGAGAAGVYSLARGTSPLSGSEFWLSIAAGAVIGAAVGAMIAALPLALKIAYVAKGVSWFGVFAARLLVCVMGSGLVRIGQAISAGSSPAEILAEDLGGEVATSAIKGAIVAILNEIQEKLEDWSEAHEVASMIVGYICTAVPILLEIYNDPNWFKNSPSKPLGIPAWAFAGTGAYTGRNESQALTLQLQTMPLAP